MLGQADTLFNGEAHGAVAEQAALRELRAHLETSQIFNLSQSDLDSIGAAFAMHALRTRLTGKDAAEAETHHRLFIETLKYSHPYIVLQNLAFAYAINKKFPAIITQLQPALEEVIDSPWESGKSWYLLDAGEKIRDAWISSDDKEIAAASEKLLDQVFEKLAAKGAYENYIKLASDCTDNKLSEYAKAKLLFLAEYHANSLPVGEMADCAEELFYIYTAGEGRPIDGAFIHLLKHIQRLRPKETDRLFGVACEMTEFFHPFAKDIAEIISSLLIENRGRLNPKYYGVYAYYLHCAMRSDKDNAGFYAGILLDYFRQKNVRMAEWAGCMNRDEHAEVLLDLLPFASGEKEWARMFFKMAASLKPPQRYDFLMASADHANVTDKLRARMEKACMVLYQKYKGNAVYGPMLLYNAVMAPNPGIDRAEAMQLFFDFFERDPKIIESPAKYIGVSCPYLTPLMIEGLQGGLPPQKMPALHRTIAHFIKGFKDYQEKLAGYAMAEIAKIIGQDETHPLWPLVRQREVVSTPEDHPVVAKFLARMQAAENAPEPKKSPNKKSVRYLQQVRETRLDRLKRYWPKDIDLVTPPHLAVNPWVEKYAENSGGYSVSFGAGARSLENRTFLRFIRPSPPLPPEANRLDGWKFHVQVDRPHVEAALDALLPILSRHNIDQFKVWVGKSSANDNQRRKVFTVYMDDRLHAMGDVEKMLAEIEVALRSMRARPCRPICNDRAVPGSQYIYYRSDRSQNGAYVYADDAKGHNSGNMADPFISIDVGNAVNARMAALMDRARDRARN